MDNPTKILLVEDNAGDALLLGHALEGMAGFEMTWVGTLAEGLVKLGDGMYSAILLDLSLADSQGLETVQRCFQGAAHIPIIVLTGMDDEELAMQALRMGAQDYLVKGRIDQHVLVRSIQYAMQRQQLMEDRERLLRELQAARDHLEKRVANRTRELQSAVETLQEEVGARMTAEERLRQANRSLWVIGECDQALVRAHSEQQLLEEVCRILVEIGGYRLAWAGFRGEGPTARTVPVAFAGHDDGFMEYLKNAPCHEDCSSPGPCGAALRTEQPSICSDIATDEAYGPCRDEALRRGHRSSVALPLRNDLGVFGALAIYSEKPSAFGPDEVKLLAELADDLAFGITALRNRRQREQAENALRSSNELLERMFSNTHMLVAYMDKHFNFVRVNRRYAESGAHDEEYFVGRNHFDLYPNEENLAIFRQVIQTGEPFAVYEKPFEYPDQPERGVTYWNWSLTAVRGNNGTVAGLVMSLLDVTEYRRSRDALIQTERQAEQARLALANIVETSDDAILGVSLEGVIISWNSGAKRIWGYSEKDAIGKSISTLLPISRLSEALEVLRKVGGGQKVGSFDITGKSRQGRPLELSMTISAIIDADGRIVGASVIARDISEQRRLEREVLRIGDIERQRIGHELHDMLGQNLTGVAFMSKVLEQKLATRNLEEAEDARDISRLLNESTSLTRSLARGLVPVELKAEGLMTALRELTNNTEKFMGVACAFHCQAPVTIDDSSAANHLYRIAQEAITNAARHGKASRIDVELTCHDRSVVLTIRDDGAGLPREIRKSKGLGLRIMRYRANTIGASLSLHRGAEGGTTVRCCLPV